jgi:hypothetical protein
MNCRKDVLDSRLGIQSGLCFVLRYLSIQFLNLKTKDRHRSGYLRLYSLFQSSQSESENCDNRTESTSVKKSSCLDVALSSVRKRYLTEFVSKLSRFQASRFCPGGVCVSLAIGTGGATNLWPHRAHPLLETCKVAVSVMFETSRSGPMAVRSLLSAFSSPYSGRKQRDDRPGWYGHALVWGAAAEGAG